MLPLLVLVGALVMLSWLAWSPLTRTIRRIADQARRKKHDDDDNGEASNALLEDEFGDNNKRGLGCCLGKGLTVDAGATGAVAVVSAGSVVSKLLPYVLPEKWWLFSGSVALALATAMALGVPVLLRRVIDGVIVPASSSEALNTDAAFRTAAINVGLASLLFAVRNVASGFGHYALRHAAERAASRVRVALLRKAYCLPAGEGLLASCGVGSVLSVLQIDAGAFKEVLCDSLNQVVHGSVYVVGGLALCVRLDPLLTLAVAATGTAVGLLGRRLSSTRRLAAQACARAAASSSQAAEESLSALRLVKAYGNEDLEASRYAAAERASCAAIDAATCQQQAAKNVVEFLQRCTLCGVVLAGAMRVHAGYLSSGDLVSFSYYCLEVGGAIDKLVACVGALQAAVGASARVVELLDAPVEFAEDARTATRSRSSDSLAQVPDEKGRLGEAINHDLEAGISLVASSKSNDDGGDGDNGAAFAMNPDAVAMEFAGVSFQHARSSSSNEARNNGNTGNGNTNWSADGISERMGLLEDFSGRKDPGNNNDSERSSHPHDNWGLHDVTFAVRRGEVVALVGPSGAGKSTLLDLAARFYDPHRGAVKVCGFNSKSMPLNVLRQRIGWVQQSGAMIRGTVAENIRYGKLSASQADLERAAVGAGAAAFIAEWPEGWNHHISSGSGGMSGVSGGQAARIAVARALVRHPQVLLLDEPSAALDAVSETNLIAEIRQRSKQDGIATLMVAHRLATVVKCDAVVVLENGRVVQKGTHAQLFAQTQGLYRRMCDAQGVRATELALE